jgi:hypothetical protein
MPGINEQDLRNLIAKYKGKMEKQLGTPVKSKTEVPIFSREYQEFKKELMPARMTLYEKLCNKSEKILKIKPKPETAKKLQKSIDIAHLNITPVGVVSFSILGPVAFIIFITIFSLLLTSSFFFIVIGLFVGLMLISILTTLPNMIANGWRMKASNQMVLCVFYVVTYMRHTSNLENALNFAAEHLGPPLSLDMKKVLWDVETQKYDSIRSSLDSYLETWREWNMEFIEAFHLIESSLYEPAEVRRVELLDRSLDVMLEETYEKMLHYAHNLQSPITMLHMLGVVMPILGLVVLPLVVSFMENVRWYHLSVLYNVLLPLGIFYLAKNILSTRPTGYGDYDISEQNPELKKYKKVLINIGKLEIKISPFFIAMIIGISFLFLGFSPILMNLVGVPDIGFGGDDPNSVCGSTFCLLEYKLSKATEGPTSLYLEYIYPSCIWPWPWHLLQIKI